MLINYAFSNFQSFLEHTEVSFRLNGKVPETSWFTHTETGEKTAKVMAVGSLWLSINNTAFFTQKQSHSDCFV